MLKVLGKHPSGARKERIMKSPNYKEGTFQNIEITPFSLQNASFLKIAREFFLSLNKVRPKKTFQPQITDLKNIVSDKPIFVWFGHSSYFLQHQNFKVLVDPIFSGYASPFPLFGKSFSGSDAYTADDFPNLDLLVLSHDHYDHLDYKTILKLAAKVKKVVTSLGVGAHLEYWGIPQSKIIELDWNEKTDLGKEASITATPTRHFSGRTFKRAQSLWSSFVLRLGEYNIFLGADSGYGTHFKIIGDKYGPFDLAILENGQYGREWPFIHMVPEDTAKAFADLRAKVLLPVHWGKFVLSYHPWQEPIERIVAIASEKKINIVTPRIGEVYTIGEPFENKSWWREYINK
ncbi:MAG: MBL fold metallo-hydrolase [Candidatus Doudnabacteria bacterium]